jgi:hypothetical protein
MTYLRKYFNIKAMISTWNIRYVIVHPSFNTFYIYYGLFTVIYDQYRKREENKSKWTKSIR